jgi:hypothetical protein
MSANHQRALRLVLALLILASLAIASLPAQAQTQTVVSITPATQQIAMGEVTQVTVYVTNVQGLYSIDISLQFDPSVIEIVGSSPNQPVQVIPGSFMDIGYASVNAVDNIQGTVHYAKSLVNANDPKSGSGPLFIMRVQGKRTGTSTLLTFTGANLRQINGALINATLTPGRVIVGPQSNTTGTPTPTQTPPTPTVGPTPNVDSTQTPLPPTAAATAPVLSPASTMIILTAAPATVAPDAPIQPTTGTDVIPTSTSLTPGSGAAIQPNGAAPGATATTVVIQAQGTPNQLPTNATAATPTTRETAIAPELGEQAEGTAAPTSALVFSRLPPGDATAQATTQATPEQAARLDAFDERNRAPAAQPGAAAVSVDTRRQLANATIETLLAFGVCGVGFFFVVAIVAVCLMLMVAGAKPAVNPEVEGDNPP